MPRCYATRRACRAEPCGMQGLAGLQAVGDAGLYRCEELVELAQRRGRVVLTSDVAEPGREALEQHVLPQHVSRRLLSGTCRACVEACAVRTVPVDRRRYGVSCARNTLVSIAERA